MYDIKDLEIDLNQHQSCKTEDLKNNSLTLKSQYKFGNKICSHKEIDPFVERL